MDSAKSTAHSAQSGQVWEHRQYLRQFPTFVKFDLRVWGAEPLRKSGNASSLFLIICLIVGTGPWLATENFRPPSLMPRHSWYIYLPSFMHQSPSWKTIAQWGKFPAFHRARSVLTVSIAAFWTSLFILNKQKHDFWEMDLLPSSGEMHILIWVLRKQLISIIMP
jgi:hypothetical protein